MFRRLPLSGLHGYGLRPTFMRAVSAGGGAAYPLRGGGEHMPVTEDNKVHYPPTHPAPRPLPPEAPS